MTYSTPHLTRFGTFRELTTFGFSQGPIDGFTIYGTLQCAASSSEPLTILPAPGPTSS